MNENADLAVGAGDVWVRRVRTRTYLGHNTRGAEVAIGPVEQEGVFTPGELMKLALAGCTGLTADAAMTRRLGDDVAATIYVSAEKDLETERYPEYRERLEIDLSSLEPEARERLVDVIHRAIDKACSVGRTIQQGATVELTVSDPR